MSQKTSPKSNIVVNGVKFTVATTVRKYSDGTYKTTVLVYESPSSSEGIIIGEKKGNTIEFTGYDYDLSTIGQENGNILESQAGSATLLNTSKEQVESVKSNFATTSEEISAYDSMNGSPNQSTDTTNQESTSDTGSTVPSPAGLPAGSPADDPAGGAKRTSLPVAVGETEINASDFVLRYPFNQSDSTYDYIKIRPFEYTPSLNINNPMGSIRSVVNRPKNFRDVTILLPMTPTISETNAVGWGKDELNPIQQRFGAAAINSFNEIEKGNFSGALGGQIEAARDLLEDKQTGSFIKSYFAGLSKLLHRASALS